MAEGARPDNLHRADGSTDSQPDLQELARDWITLWQSELTALAADQEMQENWAAMMSLWAGAAAAMVNAMPRAAPRPSRSSGAGRRDRPTGPGNVPPAGRTAAAAAPGAPAAAAAPDPRDAEIQRLGGRVAELESRLAQLEQGSGGGNRKQPRRTRKRVVPDGGS
jgi:hypothetical protein